MFREQRNIGNSIRVKKENFKAQIRRAQLNQIFATKRLQWQSQEQKLWAARSIHDKISKLRSFSQVQTEAQSLQQKSLQQQVSQELLALIHQHPDSPVVYLLAGNFLIQRPQRVSQFGQFVVESEYIQKIQESYTWFVAIFFSSILKQASISLLDTSENNSYLQQIEQFQVVLQRLLEKQMLEFSTHSQKAETLRYLLVIYQILLDFGQTSGFFPFKITNMFFYHIHGFYQILQKKNQMLSRQMKILSTTCLLTIIEQLKTRNLVQQPNYHFQVSSKDQKTVLTQGAIDNFLLGSGNVFLDNIRSCSDRRIECLQALRTLSYLFPIPTGQYLFFSEILKELFYLLDKGTQTCRVIILQTFNNVFFSLTNKAFQQFLNLQWPVHLTHVLYSALTKSSNINSPNEKDCEILFLCLKLVQSLLQKASSIDERFLQKIILCMQQQGLIHSLDQLGSRRYSQRIEQVYADIVDSYFSQIDAQTQFTKENDLNLKDHGLSSLQQGQQLGSVQKNLFRNNYRQGQHTNKNSDWLDEETII